MTKERIISPKYKDNCLKETILEVALSHVLLKGNRQSQRLEEIQFRNKRTLEEVEKRLGKNSWEEQKMEEQQKKELYKDSNVATLAKKLFKIEIRKYNLASKNRYADAKKRVNLSIDLGSNGKLKEDVNKTIRKKIKEKIETRTPQSGIILYI